MAENTDKDPNEPLDQERARGEDAKLADIASVKEHAAEPVPYKITGGK